MRCLVASALVLLAVTRASGAQVAPPTVRSIQVGRDTIRFFARVEEYESPEVPVFGFVRATGEWVRIGGDVRLTPRHLPWERHDAIRVAPGLRLVGRATPGRRPPGFSRFVLTGDDGRRHPVEADVSPARAWAVASRDWWSMHDFTLARPRVSG